MRRNYLTKAVAMGMSAVMSLMAVPGSVMAAQDMESEAVEADVPGMAEDDMAEAELAEEVTVTDAESSEGVAEESEEETVEGGAAASDPRILNRVTTWDCVWFGSYWQEDTNGDGKADENDDKQPIKWRVLDVNGDDALLLADKCLDARAYNTLNTSITWEKSTIRSWLNGYGAGENTYGTDYFGNGASFMDMAFSAAEQAAIKTTAVDNDNLTQGYYNSNYSSSYASNDSYGGSDTSDKLFLLSYAEVTNPDYGFDSDGDRYGTGNARIGLNTTYARTTRNAYNNPSYGNSVFWWLRSPGHYSNCALVVHYGGSPQSNNSVGSARSAVRPALHISLSSSLLSHAGTVSSDGNVNETAATGQGGSSNAYKDRQYKFETEINGKGIAYAVLPLYDAKGELLKNTYVTCEFDDGKTYDGKTDGDGYADIAWSTDSSCEVLDSKGKTIERLLKGKLYLKGSNQQGEINPGEIELKVSVKPLSFSQEWIGNCSAKVKGSIGEDASITVGPGKAEVAVEKAEAGAEGGVTLNVKNEYAEGVRELTLKEGFNAKISVSEKLGPTAEAKALGQGIDFSGLSGKAGVSYGDGTSMGMKIRNYDPGNADSLGKVGKFLVGATALSSGNTMLLKFAEWLGFNAFNQYEYSDNLAFSAGISAASLSLGEKESKWFDGSLASASYERVLKTSISDDRESNSKKYAFKLDSALVGKLGDVELGKNSKFKSSVLSGKYLDRRYDISCTNNFSNDTKELSLKGLLYYNDTGVLSTNSSEEIVCDVKYSGDQLKKLENDVPAVKTFTEGHPKFMLESAMKEIYKGVDDSEASGQYTISSKEKTTCNFPIELGLSAFLGVEGGVSYSGTSMLGYTLENGTSQKGKMTRLSRSNIEGEVDARSVGITDILGEPIAGIFNLAKDFFTRTWDTITNTVKEGFAQVKSFVQNVGEGAQRFINIISPGNWFGGWSAKVAVMSYKPIINYGDGISNISAYGDDIDGNALLAREAVVIGSPYYVYLSEDEAGKVIIEDFSDTPLELKLNYTNDMFEDNGVDIADAGELAIYRYEEDKQGYMFVGREVNTAEKSVTAKITQAGQYLLLIENKNNIKDTYIYREIVADGNPLYTVSYTASVSFNGTNHIEKGGKSSKSRTPDVEVKVVDKTGRELPSSEYKVVFKNNKNAAGVNKPYFTIKLKGKVDPLIKKAVKNTRCEFEIEPMDISKLYLTPRAGSDHIQLRGLSFVSGTGKKINMKPYSKGRGDFSYKVNMNSDGKYYAEIKGLGNYKGCIKIKL